MISYVDVMCIKYPNNNAQHDMHIDMNILILHPPHILLAKASTPELVYQRQ